jgi:polyferredoxin
LRKAIAGALLVLMVLWLPFDIASIRDGLEFQPSLALGISLKLLMHILAIVGLLMDKTFGYAFLLGATLQGLLVSTSSLQAIPTHEWLIYKEQLFKPAFDVVVRIASIIFLATRPGRIIGKGAPK